MEAQNKGSEFAATFDRLKGHKNHTHTYTQGKKSTTRGNDTHHAALTQRCASPLAATFGGSRSAQPAQLQQCTTPLPQLGEKTWRETNSSYHRGAHEEGARQNETAGVHLSKDASRRVKTAERRVFCARYTSVIPGARILLVSASVNGRPCLSGAKVPLRQRCCAPCSPLDKGVTTTPPTAERQTWSGVGARLDCLPARMLHAPLGFKFKLKVEKQQKTKNLFRVI